MIRRIERRNGLPFYAALTATIAATPLALAFVAYFAIPDPRHPEGRAPTMITDISDPTNKTDARPLFPYSVIPGGVRDAAELKATLRRDAVAARHYAGFRAENAVLIFLRYDRMAYVSYRLNHKIYWTSRKVRISHGEFLLTDGGNLVRARCGNRISETPQQPTSEAEPPSEAMDWLPPATVPDYMAEIEAPPALPREMPLNSPSLFEAPPVISVTAYSETPATDILLVVNRPWLGTQTPEPATYVMLVCGLALMLYIRFRAIRPR